MNRNESFEHNTGGIAKLCRECHFSDPLTHHNDQSINMSTDIKDTKQYTLFYFY